MTRDLWVIIRDYVEAKKMLDKYSNYDCTNRHDWLTHNHLETQTEHYLKELEQKVSNIYNGIE